MWTMREILSSIRSIHLSSFSMEFVPGVGFNDSFDFSIEIAMLADVLSFNRAILVCS